MTEINVPKLMNALLADLQSEAWSHGVKLVADASTELVVATDEFALQGCLTQVLGTLIRNVRPGSSISLITALETVEPGMAPDEGQLSADAAIRSSLRIQIAAPALDGASAAERVDEEVRGATIVLRPAGATVEVSATLKSWSLTVTMPDARGAPSASPAAKGRTAVVVDDDVDTQDFLRAVLEGSGYRVISVSDGFDALLVIERYQPAVVLTDILMPNMNGIDLVGRIKHAQPHLPVIVFSGYRDALVNNIAGLPDRILPKPMTRDQVLDALEAVVGQT